MTPFLINPATLRDIPGFDLIDDKRLDVINAHLVEIIKATIRQEQARRYPVKLDLGRLAAQTFATATPEKE